MAAYLKTPLYDSLNRFASQKADDAISITGRELPCHVVSRTGQVVTIAFDVTGPFTLPQVTMPVLTSTSDWLPIQAGTKGTAVPADAYLGGVSGLGGGTADLSQRANLATHYFVPVSNVSWAPPGGDTDKRALVGKNGVYAADAQGKATLTLDVNNGFNLSFGGGVLTMGTAGISLSFEGHSIVINSSAVVIDGKEFLPHTHSGVQSGGSDTGPVA